MSRSHGVSSILRSVPSGSFRAYSDDNSYRIFVRTNAVHAAMNVVEPVLDARDTEILRLRRLMGAKLPGRLTSWVPPAARARPS